LKNAKTQKINIKVIGHVRSIKSVKISRIIIPIVMCRYLIEKKKEFLIAVSQLTSKLAIVGKIKMVINKITVPKTVRAVKNMYWSEPKFFINRMSITKRPANTIQMKPKRKVCLKFCLKNWRKDRKTL
jgi:hypothetical protein